MAYNIHGSATLTESDAAQIKLLLDMSVLQSRIAAMFDVNGGRISEIKTGKSFFNVKPALELAEKLKKFFNGDDNE
ncbi:MAG: hypothetical protein COB13_007560 [OCS116 cluster bacterium]|nr:hypothetical protein [OCS116 cluster bacterium]